MKISKPVRAVLILVVIMINVGCDQVSKTMVREHLSPYANLQYLHNHFVVTRVENTGAFLSAGDQIPGLLRILLLSVLPAAALLGGIIYLIRQTKIDLIRLIAICCIIGGGIGNIYDRIVHGSVTDFLYIDFVIFHTGVFNMADLSITIGVIILLLYLLIDRNKNNKPTIEEPEPAA